MQIQQLTTQLNAKDSEIAGLTSSKTNLEEQVSTLQGEVSALTSSNADLEGQVTTLQAEVERLEQELAALGEGVVPASVNIPEDELLTEAELNDLTKDEIKVLLDARSISYTTADTKAVLIDLYLGRA